MPGEQRRARGRPRADEAGDLRATLLDISCRLLDTGGPSLLSLREVARQAGCTHQAPYHHFESREGLLAELVRLGFEDLRLRLKAVHDRADQLTIEALLTASAESYLAFAWANPGVFRIMFRPDMCNPEHFPAVAETAQGAHEELLRLARRVQVGHGAEGSAEGAVDEVLVNILWAHVHGLATLMLDGPLAGQYADEAHRQAMMGAVSRRFAAMVAEAGGESVHDTR